MSAKPSQAKPSLSILPTHKTKPAEKMSDFKWLIYGPPGIGKTTFANAFDNALILAFEDGTKHLEAYKVPIAKWEDLQNIYDALKASDHRFKTVVFDTVDIFYRLAVDHVCKSRKIEHPADEAWGKGYDMVKNQVYASLSAFQALGLGMVFVSHSTEREISTRHSKFTKTTVTLPKGAADIFVPYVDIVGYCHFDEETQTKRLIRFTGSDYVDAKKRTSGAIALPDACELSVEAVQSYFVN